MKRRMFFQSLFGIGGAVAVGRLLQAEEIPAKMVPDGGSINDPVVAYSIHDDPSDQDAMCSLKVFDVDENLLLSINRCRIEKAVTRVEYVGSIDGWRKLQAFETDVTLAFDATSAPYKWWRAIGYDRALFEIEAEGQKFSRDGYIKEFMVSGGPLEGQDMGYLKIVLT